MTDARLVALVPVMAAVMCLLYFALGATVGEYLILTAGTTVIGWVVQAANYVVYRLQDRGDTTP